ncbi:basic secretory protein-like protein [Paenibacillus sonchi]|uniref:basic secretory protein-like protein n=1 Tax=Paenibacillus sonchi TaxID=373687 RepID=UPI001E3A3B7B|nr:basic secretory protein-like protein [Paenibacillus sonchi]
MLKKQTILLSLFLLTIVFFASFFSIPARAADTSYPRNLAPIGTITVSDTSSPDAETKENASDRNYFSKWLVFSPTAWIQYEFPGQSTYALNSYKITSANDHPERDPQAWTLEASIDGVIWTAVDSRQNENFSYRFQSKSYSFSNTTAYKYYRFNFQCLSGTIVQLSEIELFDGSQETYAKPNPLISASGETLPDHGKANAFDGTSNSSWLTPQSSGWLQFDFGQQIVIDGYAFSAANSAPDSDPKIWDLKASTDNVNWITIDSRNSEDFRYRHQRNHYVLPTNQKAYRYYRFELYNHSGDALQIGEVAFSRPDDAWHTVAPIIDMHNMDTTNGYLFDQAIPDPQSDILAVIRQVCNTLYASPADVPIRPRTLHVTIGNYDGVASVSGSPTDADLTISSRYLKSYADSGKPLRQEILGILYHELTHVYQFDDRGTPDIGYMIEGMADAVRFENGYHDRYSMTPGGTWHDGYGTSGNFFRWIDEKKHTGFLRELNASLNPFDGQTWTPAVFQQITGTDVDTLWNEYQVSLDKSQPTAPGDLTATSTTDTTVTLSWSASTDNLGVAGYNIYSNGIKISTTQSTNYKVNGLTTGSSYTFMVKAVDHSGNESSASNTITVIAKASNTATIYYRKGFATPYIHYQPDGEKWTTAPGVAMADSEYNGYSKSTITLGSATGLTAAFNNGSGMWDNNGGANYKFLAGVSTFINGTITSGFPQPDGVTIVISVPANTPANEDLYLTSNLTGWNTADANYKLTRNADGTYSIKLNVAAGTNIQYKITRGSWATVEVNSNGSDIANRSLTTTAGAPTVSISVQRWKDK